MLLFFGAKKRRRELIRAIGKKVNNNKNLSSARTRVNIFIIVSSS